MIKRTTTEAELREWIAQGKTFGEIGRMLGRRPQAVRAACNVLGIGSHPTWDEREKHDLAGYVADLERGLTIREISDIRGIPQTNIHQALRRAGLPTCARKAIRAKAAQPVSAHS